MTAENLGTSMGECPQDRIFRGDKNHRFQWTPDKAGFHLTKGVDLTGRRYYRCEGDKK